MKIPILQIKDILITSVQVDLTDQESLVFQEDVLKMVTDTNAHGIVIDITAMHIVDSFMARILDETVKMVQVLGAKVVLCGIQPPVAITLMEMGRQLIDVDMVLDLDQGIEKIHELTMTQNIF